MPIDFAKELATIDFDAELMASHDAKAETKAAPVNVGGRGTGLDLRLSRRRSTEALPAVGSAIGAAVGGLTSPVTGPVGPVVGAGIGGAGGTALQALVKGESPDANAVIESGLLNAALQGVAPVGEAVAKGIYKGGVALLPRTLKQEFPQLAEAGFREGIPLTRRGAQAAGRAAGASARKADDIIKAAELQGAGNVSPFKVIGEFKPVMDKARKARRLGRPDDAAEVVDRASTFMRRNKGGITPTAAQGLKREAQELATSAYKARDRGASINETTALLDEAQARGLKADLERVAPDVGPVNQRTQDLMGIERAADHASGTGHVLSRLGGAGVLGGLSSAGGAVPALAAAGAGMALTTPGGLTATGLALRPMASHLPAAVRTALILQLLGEDAAP